MVHFQLAQHGMYIDLHLHLPWAQSTKKIFILRKCILTDFIIKFLIYDQLIRKLNKIGNFKKL